MPLTATAIADAMQQHAEEVWLTLLTVEHPDITTVRLVNNTHSNVVSGGDTYVAYPFSVAEPEDSAEALNSVSLTLPNITRDLIDELRTIPDPLRVTIAYVLASSPSTIQKGPYTLELMQAGGNAEALTGRLTYEPILQAAFPGYKFTPQRNPGVFGRTE